MLWGVSLLVVIFIRVITGFSIHMVDTQKMTPESFNVTKNGIIKAEALMIEGATIKLNHKEQKLDEYFLNFKRTKFENGTKDPTTYVPGLHFFRGKSILLNNSTIFKIIQMIPKGSNLMLHGSASVSSEWFIKNLTYRSDIVLCTSIDGTKLFEHIDHPSGLCIEDKPPLIIDLRKISRSKKEFDDKLEKLVNLCTMKPEMDYPDASIVWKRFQTIFISVSQLLNYWPVYKDYLYQTLHEMYEDNVMYIELRMEITHFQDQNNKTIDGFELLTNLELLKDEFKATHKGFFGFRIIMIVDRDLSEEELKEKLHEFQEYTEEFPNFVVGFDLVGREENGSLLSKHINSLLEVPATLKFFFHAGETKSFGSDVDYNVIDAVLMNSPRIAHAYSLIKHPVLWNAVKMKGVAIEVAPISNQVLQLVNDLRNHPASFYVSENIPIVIGSDSPSFWGAKGLSFDFYYALMCFTPQNMGLKILKQLALNSIKFSTLSTEDKKRFTKAYKKSWDKFVVAALKLI